MKRYWVFHLNVYFCYNIIDPFIFFSFNYVIWRVPTDPVPTWDN